MLKKKFRFNSFIAGVIVTVTVFAIILSMFIIGLSDSEKLSSEEACRLVEDSIKRAAVTCYAIEGIYPPSLEYLTENYDVVIDTDTYIVDYKIFASNIMPTVSVWEAE